jgi:polyhydroxyalkanoate synthase subunit PhaE
MAEETSSSGEIANQFMKTWTEAGTHALKGWFDLMGSAVRSSEHEPEDSQPEDSEPEAMHQRLLGYQQLQLRLLKLSFEVWQDLVPKIEAGADWQQILSAYRGQIREQVEAFSARTRASQDTAALWQTYIEEMQKLNQPWVKAWGAAIEPLSQTASGASKPWIELNNLYWNLLYEAGGSMQMPFLGPSRGFNDKLRQAFEAWSKLHPASIDYQIVLAEIQMQSCEQLMQELIALAEQGETVKDWAQFQQIWGRTADKTFEQAFCLEANLRVRGKLLNALNHHKLCQQDLMEVWMKTMNMPTRSEVDEVHKSIYELRKELKSLKKNLAKYEAEAQVTPPDLEAPPTPMPHQAQAVRLDPEEISTPKHWTTAIFTRKN